MLDLSTFLSPITLSFLLGVLAGLTKIPLSFPKSFGQTIGLYLMFAIGLKGGMQLSGCYLDQALWRAIGAGLVLSFGLPFLAYGLSGMMTGLSAGHRALIGAHYGSIGIVTFLVAQQYLERSLEVFSGHWAAIAAMMEGPAILSGLYLYQRHRHSYDRVPLHWKEVFMNGSILLLAGGFFIGMVTGKKDISMIEPFFVHDFKGILCLFLMDLGMKTAQSLQQEKDYLSSVGFLAFGFVMPCVGGALGIMLAYLMGLNPGDGALLATLSASASYIAVPAALQVSLPHVNLSPALALSLGLTFPFNLLVGIPLYTFLARTFLGG
jgi:hypothetical protein